MILDCWFVQNRNSILGSQSTKSFFKFLKCQVPFKNEVNLLEFKKFEKKKIRKSQKQENFSKFLFQENISSLFFEIEKIPLDN